jgi:hypothetical protein
MIFNYPIKLTNQINQKYTSTSGAKKTTITSNPTPTYQHKKQYLNFPNAQKNNFTVAFL